MPFYSIYPNKNNNKRKIYNENAAHFANEAIAMCVQRTANNKKYGESCIHSALEEYSVDSTFSLVENVHEK